MSLLIYPVSMLLAGLCVCRPLHQFFIRKWRSLQSSRDFKHRQKCRLRFILHLQQERLGYIKPSKQK